MEMAVFSKWARAITFRLMLKLGKASVLFGRQGAQRLNMAKKCVDSIQTEKEAQVMGPAPSVPVT